MIVNFYDVESLDQKALTEYCRSIYENYGSNNNDAQLMYKPNENEMIYMTYLHFMIDKNDTISDIRIEGIYLTK